ncbi:GNAT family N-acetyltransferase [Clostridium weizhouense]|uniref:GNAT family N-acetyltransferase n=1 Tax=Clostridium weizhouense TaxID=2859781 RepID=A0ABS7AMH5_9CLOT|nr:GNAT family N-acetyltransferase [Clostridium weizhouense]MBW6409857.1 GNAT family N-acetyltransferase [Clostridium weizhouense]
MDIIINKMKKEDFNEMMNIYNEGIKTGISTFQTEVPSYNEWDEAHIKTCRLIAKSDKKILGWVALSKIFAREVYNGFLELSIYIKEGYKGNGIGRKLLNSVIEESEKEEIWSLQSLIISTNEASINLHSNCGFRKVGYWEKAGKMKDGIWHDVVVMERRSKMVGK